MGCLAEVHSWTGRTASFTLPAPPDVFRVSRLQRSGRESRDRKTEADATSEGRLIRRNMSCSRGSAIPLRAIRMSPTTPTIGSMDRRANDTRLLVVPTGISDISGTPIARRHTRHPLECGSQSVPPDASAPSAAIRTLIQSKTPVRTSDPDGPAHPSLSWWPARLLGPRERRDLDRAQAGLGPGSGTPPRSVRLKGSAIAERRYASAAARAATSSSSL
jgi:hypothetical protein